MALHQPEKTLRHTKVNYIVGFTVSEGEPQMRTDARNKIRTEIEALNHKMLDKNLYGLMEEELPYRQLLKKLRKFIKEEPYERKIAISCYGFKYTYSPSNEPIIANNEKAELLNPSPRGAQ